MQKTINVNLAGRIFYVEEEAYAELDHYLQEVKQHFSKFEDSAEILADIEARIAEQLLEGAKETSPIVNKQAITQVIHTMGKPSDFADAEDGLKEKNSETQHNSHTGGQKRFYRNEDDHILGGVASGIASYFDTDALWIRLLFVASTFLGGYGILIYVVLWIIVPKATTLSEKLEMNGSRITLESLEKSIKEKIIHNPKAKQGARQAAEAFRPAASKVGHGLSWLVQVLLRMIGLAFVITATMGMIGLLIGGTAFVTGSTSAYTEFPLRDFLGLPQFYAAIFAIFFIIFVPLLFLLLGGLSLAALKSRFSRPAVIALIVLWATAASVAAGLAARNAPRFEAFMQDQPAYQVKSTTRTVDSYTKLSVSNGLQVELVQAAAPSLTISAVQGDQDRIQTSVANDTLTITKKDTQNRWCFFCMHPRPRVTVTVPSLSDIRLENATRLHTAEFKTPLLHIAAQNGSSADMQGLNSDTIELLASNASSLTLSGTTTQLTIQAQNAGVVHGENLKAETVKAQAENASRITVQPTQRLEAFAQNSSRIYYVGAPSQITGTASPAPETDRIPPIEWDSTSEPSPTPLSPEPPKLKPNSK